jgi:hypothetical protein
MQEHNGGLGFAPDVRRQPARAVFQATLITACHLTIVDFKTSSV